MFEFRVRELGRVSNGFWKVSYHLVDVGHLGLKDGNGVTN
jgi:hypothetical protein